MHLTGLDIGVIVAFFAINLGIGLYFARGSGKSVGDYFLSGRSAPWWLAGTSMVATTFAVDTPLAVTGFVAQNGVAGNWLWWNMAASGLLTVFFFAALWRRSGVLTDVEFIELRYGGRPATWLRGVRAIYQGVIVNTIVMGWVNLAMVKILTLTLNVEPHIALYVCLIFTAAYVLIGGFWSVLVTDLLQFVVKMGMAIVLAFAAVAACGGLAAMKVGLAHVDAVRQAAGGGGGGSILAFFPQGNGAWMPITTFLVFVGVAWWASSYPGAEPGGGSYIAQRIFASRSEGDAVGATLFFNVAHYALRPWPWILVALAALVLYPHGVIGANGKPDPELGYVKVLVDHLPPALRGLMMAGFLAAYMSTIGTQLNLGASYLTNDLWRRFINKEGSDRHYVVVSRWMTVVALVLAAIVTQFMSSVGDAWKYMLTLTAGVGLVMILRWYWWRINAWSEISALAASAVFGSASYFVVDGDDPNATAKRLLITVVATTIVWIVTTLLTQPETDATLQRFYGRVRPARAGWERIARTVQYPRDEDDHLGIALLDWICGLGLVYGTLFGIGLLILGTPLKGILWLIFALICGLVIARTVRVNTIRSLASIALVAALVGIPFNVSAAGADKELTNVKGAVAYERGDKHARVFPSASVAMSSSDWAETGADSLARITLPDSSRVLMGSDTRVQLVRFDQSDVAHARVILESGKVRFTVEHPTGAKADYQFSTPTSQIAVRGTEGDISVDGDQLTVNVYSTKIPDAPVSVTFTTGSKSGSVITLNAGQSLVATLVNGIIQTQVDKITAAAMNEFAELGVPTSVQGAQQKASDAASDAVKKALPHLPF